MDAEGIDHAANPRKRMSRNEVLEKKKRAESIIKAASSQKDPLAYVLPSIHHHIKGMSIFLESGRGDKIKSHLKLHIQKLLKVNMEGNLGLDWPVEEKVKLGEMVSPEARYIFVYESRNDINTISLCEKEMSSSSKETIIGFVHYRFTMEEEVPVVYVYELQLEAIVQGRGLGTLLMEVIEHIACKNKMGAVVLTVQKTNISAINFYMKKLGYITSATSPSKFSLVTNYEILCKVFNQEARCVFEES